MAKKVESTEKFKTMIGGQALIEGIMMLGPDKSSVVVRKKDGLRIKTEPRKVSEGFSLKKLPLIAAYCLVLVNEIVKANLTMIHYLLSPQILPEPALVRFRTDLKTHTAQVLLANSITLTPGTITVEMKDGEYLIHCYDKTMGEGLDSSVFVSMLKKLEG